MSFPTVVAFLLIFFIIELLFFRIARWKGIVDNPNHRSSHTNQTIRGAGIIFPIALIAVAPLFYESYTYFLIGLMAISLISFIDDLSSVSNRLRILFHLGSVLLLLYQIQVLQFPFYIIIALVVLIVGTINAINFMDGINGMTGGYFLVTIATLLYLNVNVFNFVDSHYLALTLLSLCVFNFFNFRKKAVGFAGDVGSVSIGFITIFFLLKLMFVSQSIIYVLFLLVYGLDAITSIIFRLIRKENIFLAHRTHFYQYLANEKKIPHIMVAAGYFITQGIFNILLITVIKESYAIASLFSFISLVLFLLIRFRIEGSKRLFTINIKN